MIKKKYFSYFLTANTFVLAILVLIILTSLNFKSSFKSIQVEHLKIISPKSNAEINLGFSDSAPFISILNDQKEKIFEISAKDQTSITMFEKKKPIISMKPAKNGGAEIILNDDQTNPKLHLSSSDISGVFLKNDDNKTVGSFTVINDGGGGFGLANSKGAAATLLKGGDNPSLAFFSMQNQPLAAFGIMNKIPHMLISGPLKEEGILIHGGNPNSMLVVDENGKVKILISKHGVFQGKKEDMDIKKKDKKIFSFDDKNRLFPSIEAKKR